MKDLTLEPRISPKALAVGMTMLIAFLVAMVIAADAAVNIDSIDPAMIWARSFRGLSWH